MLKFSHGLPELNSIQVSSPKPLCASSIETMMAVSSGVGICLALLTILCLGISTRVFEAMGQFDLVGLLGSLAGLMILHECVHLMAYQSIKNGIQGTMGISAKTGLYAIYPKPLTKLRFIIAGMAPFALLSIVPLFLVLTGILNAEWMLPLAFVNFIGAGADLFFVGLALLYVPKNALIQSKGVTYYWGTPLKQP